jgi:hypothetical protein
MPRADSRLADSRLTDITVSNDRQHYSGWTSFGVVYYYGYP